MWVCIFGLTDLSNYELRSSRQQAARLQKHRLIFTCKR
ncbi:hypothetical protein P20495_0961 [Pseudoalteromonas sp. BSi20495]|nr:hypothetical protein P20495_0961 [Pseudoalteromonas sp. BSi20495]